MNQPKDFMSQAVLKSEQSVALGGFPAGAIIVINGKIIGEGMSLGVINNDPTGHAEINAIRAAAQALKTSTLNGATLYTSLEPCLMCLDTASWAGISMIYFACRKEKVSNNYYHHTCSHTLIKLTHMTSFESNALKIIQEWESLA